MRWLTLSGLLWAALLLLPASAFAHLTPNSEIRIDIGPDHDRIALIVPQGEYAYATGNPLGDTDRARAWIDRHLAVHGKDGHRWQVAWESVAFVQIAGPPDLQAIGRITPPPGNSPRAFNLAWSGVIDTVPSHFALIVLGSDFKGGKIGGDTLLLGALQGDRRSLTIDRADRGAFSGFANALRLGMHHIAQGHDHLLFLLALLLPAPVMATRKRWTTARPVRTTLIALAQIVTAFTIGHSLTLILGAALNWTLPPQPVEILIALSILISAIHAWRPIFAGREPLVAGGFGLVHGLAFATLIGGLGIGATERGLSIAGFNIGIEAVQLLVVALTMPALLLLARTPYYGLVRSVGAGFAGVAALAWLAERTSGIANPIAGFLDGFFGEAPWLILALTVVALLLYAIKGRSAPPMLHS